MLTCLCFTQVSDRCRPRDCSNKSTKRGYQTLLKTGNIF